MHIAFVCHIYEASASAAELLDKHFTTRNWAEALASKGLRVSVLYRFSSDSQIEQKGVSYRFFADGKEGQLRNWNRARAFYTKVKSYVETEDVDLVHAHDLFAFGPHYSLTEAVPQIPVLVQDHSGQSSIKYPWLYRAALRRVRAFMFSAPGLEANWTGNNVIENDRCVYVMENTSAFRLQGRKAAREETTLKGAPVMLSVGNLNKNKDPLTILTAFERLALIHPLAKLYLIYRHAGLESKIQQMISRSQVLEESVVLLASRKREELPAYYNSADIFVLASHREVWSYSAIEALSCGAMPILSDISSSRTLLRNGEIGSLFEPGNADDLFDELLRQVDLLTDDTPAKVRSFFEKHWSFDRLAEQAIDVYRSILSSED